LKTYYLEFTQIFASNYPRRRMPWAHNLLELGLGRENITRVEITWAHNDLSKERGLLRSATMKLKQNTVGVPTYKSKIN